MRDTEKNFYLIFVKVSYECPVLKVTRDLLTLAVLRPL